MSKVVRAALVGAGGHSGKNVVPFIPSFGNLEYIAVCDVNQGVARSAAAQIGAKLVYTSLEEVLANPDVEMVELQVPNYLHAEQAVAAFKAGKHVLSQKPIARTVAEARRMIQAAKRAKRRLGVYMDGYSDPFQWDIKAAVRAGFIGTPADFRIRYAHQGGLDLKGGVWRQSARQTGGGSFLLLTVHLINCLQWVFDTRVRRVTGFMKTLIADMEGDDAAAGALELENGLIGEAASCYVAAGTLDIPNTVLELRGTDGAFRFQRDDGILYAYSGTKTFHGEAVHYDRPGETMKFERSVREPRHPEVHEQFAAAILGEAEYPIPGEQGLQDLAVCLAMAASARTGRAVNLKKFIGAKV